MELYQFKYLYKYNEINDKIDKKEDDNDELDKKNENKIYKLRYNLANL